MSPLSSNNDLPHRPPHHRWYRLLRIRVTAAWIQYKTIIIIINQHRLPRINVLLPTPNHKTSFRLWPNHPHPTIYSSPLLLITVKTQSQLKINPWFTTTCHHHHHHRKWMKDIHRMWPCIKVIKKSNWLCWYPHLTHPRLLMIGTSAASKSPGMEPISSPNNNAYYQHHHHHHRHQHQLDISSRSTSSGSSNSSSSTPPTSYGVGSDGHHHHQQWAPHSFSTGYSNERLDQNPHQHLFSSTSFHAINHAAMPTRTTELVSNAFMLDTNALLGSGWNDFEMQM